MDSKKDLMPPLTLLFRYLTLTVFTICAVAMVAASIWTVHLFVHFASVYPGFEGEKLNLGVHQDINRIRETGGVIVASVDSNSAAEKGGIQARDLIISVNGTKLKEKPQAFYRAFVEASPGKEIHFDLIRNGISQHLVLVLEKSNLTHLSWTYLGLPIKSSVNKTVWTLYIPWLLLQLLFLAVGAFIGWFKLKEPIPFQCALLFLCSGTAIFLIDTPFLASWPSWALAMVLSFQNLTSGLVLPLALRLLSIFPNRTRLGKTLWKWQWIAFLFFSLYFFSESVDDLGEVFGWKSSWFVVNLLVKIFANIDQWLVLIFFGLAGLLLLTQRIETKDHPQVRLKIIESGFLLGILGLAIFFVIRPVLFGLIPESWRLSYGFSMLFLTLVLFSATPLSFTYAILVRKVFGIRFIIRKGLQHLLLSRGAFLLEGIIVFFVVQQVIRQGGTRLSSSPAMVSGFAVVGSLLVILALSRINRKIMPALDRRFFKEVYDVQQLLLGLSEQLYGLREQKRILQRTAATVLKALHPSRVVLLLRETQSHVFKSKLVLDNGRSRLVSIEGLEQATSSVSTMILKSEDSVVQQLEQGDSWVDVYPEELSLAVDEEARLIDLKCEFLIALPGSLSILGVMGLGAKLSEEPFSNTDKELLLTVARQLGLALENAELLEVAKREAELSRDLEIARQVQQKLFPKELPTSPDWEFAGICRPARAVGGDYYDIFEVASGKVILALGDVSGKGLGASLLMADVHAAIRSLAVILTNRLTELIEELNHRLLSETAPEDYLTLFLGLLDLDSGELRYIDCGHPPPILIRHQEKRQEKLTRGGPILGILDNNAYEQGNCKLDKGDVLVIFSDGVTEATNNQEEMFEEKRLLQLLSDTSGPDASALLESILKSVDGFTAQAEQADDISVVVVRRIGTGQDYPSSKV